ncbi:MAG: CDP-glucose 4,6-dehydratase [Gammaproteobacteria bacterium]|nr:CDP-glucose 4,6-dehydratase [Gammaproteobacteria bacterium]
MMLFGDTYRDRRVLVTGHTGFKGSWLTFWLNQLGAQIGCISLNPESELNHWDLLNLSVEDFRLDIQNAEKVRAAIEVFRPEIVFHLAAQSLVRRSYRKPIENWSSNVMGTAHVLEACRHIESVKAIVAVTTDKVYANKEWPWGYRENDRLGGHDPYSASKAACELLIDSYRKAFYCEDNAPLLASARAGNVIGGGDWSEDRLIPDLIRSVCQDESLTIRSPHATRPWQHVLECLTGYLLLGQRLLDGREEDGCAWNFGPALEGNRTVEEVLVLLQEYWPKLKWGQTDTQQPHESSLLYLDHAKAKAGLEWQPVWSLEQALQATADWYRQFHEQGAVPTGSQLTKYIDDACSAGVSWTLR